MLTEWSERVLNEYGAVLMQREGLIRPLSALPHPVEDIKLTILETLLDDDPDEELENHLRVAYVLTATFIPDQKAAIVARFHAAVSSGDLEHEGWSSAKEALAIQQEALAVQEGLSAELQGDWGELRERVLIDRNRAVVERALDEARLIPRKPWWRFWG
jgi:hypothetical protein